MGPSGATCASTSSRPPYAPTGNPPPITFPRQVRSGSIPYRCCAPPRATRKPVITSSKMSRAPAARVSSRSVSRNPALGSSTPMLPTTGSTIAHAVSRPEGERKNPRTASTSLKGSTLVSFATAAGTPGEERTPAEHVVDEVVAVHVDEVRALAARDEEGLAPDGAERAHGAVHAAWKQRPGARELLLRFCGLHGAGGVARHAGYASADR